MQEMSNLQKEILNIQTILEKFGTLEFRGKEKLDGEWIYGAATVCSLGTGNCFITIDGKKVIECTVAVHIPGTVDRKNKKLFCSILDNNAGDRINSLGGRLEVLNCDISILDSDIDEYVSTYMFRWHSIKGKCLFVEEPDYDVI